MRQLDVLAEQDGVEGGRNVLLQDGVADRHPHRAAAAHAHLCIRECPLLTLARRVGLCKQHTQRDTPCKRPAAWHPVFSLYTSSQAVGCWQKVKAWIRRRKFLVQSSHRRCARTWYRLLKEGSCCSVSHCTGTNAGQQLADAAMHTRHMMHD